MLTERNSIPRVIKQINREKYLTYTYAPCLRVYHIFPCIQQNKNVRKLKYNTFSKISLVIYPSIINCCNDETQWNKNIKYFWNENVSVAFVKKKRRLWTISKKVHKIQRNVSQMFEIESNKKQIELSVSGFFFSFSPDAMTELSMPCWHASHPVIENNLS